MAETTADISFIWLFFGDNGSVKQSKPPQDKTKKQKGTKNCTSHNILKEVAYFFSSLAGQATCFFLITVHMLYKEEVVLLPMNTAWFSFCSNKASVDSVFSQLEWL